VLLTEEFTCPSHSQELEKVYLDDVWFHVQGAYSSTSQGPPFPDASLKRHPVAGYIRAHGLLQNQFLLQVCAAAMYCDSASCNFVGKMLLALLAHLFGKTRERPRQCCAGSMAGCVLFSCWLEVGSCAGCARSSSGRSACCRLPLQCQ
jgi:hypothetical protein